MNFDDLTAYQLKRMNTRISKILAAFDFSDPALNALHAAALLAKRNSAELYVVYVKDNILEQISHATTTFTQDEHTNTILKAIIQDIETRYGLRPTLIEETGHAAEIILRTVVRFKCDLISIGSYGASGYRKGHVGSVSYNVIKYASCPVLLIPGGKKWELARKPLLPVRPIITSFRHYDFFRNLVFTNATLHILGIYASNEDENLYSLRELVASIQAKMDKDGIRPMISSSGSWNFIPQKILSTAEENDVDLIVISPAIDVSAKQFYIGPKNHFLLNNARVPLLVINKATN